LGRVTPTGPNLNRWVQLGLLAAACVGAAAGVLALNPFQENLKADLRLSDDQIALLQGPVQLSVLLVSAPLGLAIDRWVRTKLLVGLSILNVVACLLTAVAPTYPALLGARCLAVVAGNGAVITAYGLIGDLFPAPLRGRAKAVLGIAQYFGKSAIFALGGVLMAAAGGRSWRGSVLAVTGAIALVAALSFALKEPPRSETKRPPSSARESWRELWAYRRMLAPVIGGMATLDVATVGALTWSGPAFSRHFALGPGAIGMAMATALLITGVCGPLLGGVAADWSLRSRTSHRALAVLAGLSIAMAVSAPYAVVSSPVLASAMLTCLLTAGAAGLTIGIVVFVTLVPNEIRGLCLSVWLAGNAVFASVGPLAISLLSDGLGGAAKLSQALAIGCGALALLAAAVFLGGHLASRRTLQPQPGF